jgi:hypothetical protein
MKFSDEQKEILTALQWNTTGMVWQTIDPKTGTWQRKYPRHAVQSLCDYGIIRSVFDGYGDDMRCIIRYTRKGWDMIRDIQREINHK